MFPLSLLYVLCLTYFTHKNVLMHFWLPMKWSSNMLVRDLITL